MTDSFTQEDKETTNTWKVPVERFLGEVNPSLTHKNEYLSVSRLQSYEQCARQFYYKYVDKSVPPLKEDTMGAATFGSFLHDANEGIVKWVVAEEFSGLVPWTIIQQHCVRAWEETKGAKGVELYAEGVGYVRRYFEKPINHMDILDVEREFRIKVGEFDVLGYMDRIDKTDMGVNIVDYKSNRALYSRGDLDTSMQLAVYTLACRELYPWATTITAEMQMLRFGGMAQRATITTEVLSNTKDYLIAMGRKTESDHTWEPNLNANCQYCEFRHVCPKFDEATRIGLSVVKGSVTNLESVAVERETVSKIANAAYGRKKTLDDVLKRALHESPELVLNGVRYYLSHVSHTEYDTLGLLHLLKKHQISVGEIATLLSFNNAALEAWVKENRQDSARAILAAEVENMAHKVPAFSKLETRKAK